MDMILHTMLDADGAKAQHGASAARSGGYALLDIDFDAKREALWGEEKERICALLGKVVELRREEDGDPLSVCDPYVRKRICEFASAHGIGIYEAIDAIAASDLRLASSFLGKSPSRTGYQEDLQYEVLSTQSQVLRFPVRYAKGGKNAVRFPECAKSVDFGGKLIGASGCEYSASIAAKYTEDEGGAQDNQRIDLASFARVAHRIGDGSRVVVLVADGAHYGKPRACYGGMSFLDFYQKKARDEALMLVATNTPRFDQDVAELLLRL